MQDSFCCCCGIEYNFVWFDTPTEKAYQINNRLDDTLQDMWCIQRAVSNWRQHWRRIQQQTPKIFWLLPIMIGSAVSVWLNTQYHGIDDSPIQWEMHSTEVSDMWRIQRVVSNWRQHRRRIQRQRQRIFWLLPIMIGSAVNVWLNTQYHGIDDTPTTEEEYQINNWIGTASETDPIQR